MIHSQNTQAPREELTAAIIDAKIARARKLSYAELAARPVAIRLRDAAARLLMPYL